MNILIAGAPDNPSDTLWYRVADRDKEKDKDKEQEPERDRDRDLDRPDPKMFVAPVSTAAPANTASASAGVTTAAIVASPPDPELLPLEPRGFPAGPGRLAAAVLTARPRTRAAADGPRAGKAALAAAAVSRGAARGRTGLTELGQRIGAIMRRRPGSRWSEREQAALAGLVPLGEDDLVLIERYYGAEVAPAEDIRRRDLLTLLNHWPGELDRARAFWRKRGWRLPLASGEDTSAVSSNLPEGFAEWKAQAPEYAGTAWRDWSAVPSFAREEFHRWKRRRANDE